MNRINLSTIGKVVFVARAEAQREREREETGREGKVERETHRDTERQGERERWRERDTEIQRDKEREAIKYLAFSSRSPPGAAALGSLKKK